LNEALDALTHVSDDVADQMIPVGIGEHVAVEIARLHEADTLQTSQPPINFNQDLAGAKLVGRWKSGTRLDLAPDKDTGDNPNLDNTFGFHNKDAHGKVIGQDGDGIRCPRFAHIRKVYPRGDGFGDEIRRILRRGIPFGKPFHPGAGPGFEATDERGLLFMAFMTSIEDQFEFLQQVWVNPPSFPEENAGHDPLIGLSENSTITIHHEQPNKAKVTKAVDFPCFVQTTGAVYAFAPSLQTLSDLANAKL
jgi:hypothetical protein